MGRPLKKPNFDNEQLLNEVLDGIVDAYESLDKRQRIEGRLAYGAIKDLSEESGLDPSKVRKLLITAGIRDGVVYFSNEASIKVMNLYRDGRSTEEIIRMTGLKRSSVLGYLPYRKGLYRARELSTDAERIRLYRERQLRCRLFKIDIMGMTDWEKEQYLWETIEFLAGCVFYVSEPGRDECVRYKYTVTGGDLVVNGKDINITKSEVFTVFERLIKNYAIDGSSLQKLPSDKGYAAYVLPIIKRLGLESETEKTSHIT